VTGGASAPPVFCAGSGRASAGHAASTILQDQSRSKASTAARILATSAAHPHILAVGRLDDDRAPSCPAGESLRRHEDRVTVGLGDPSHPNASASRPAGSLRV